MPGRGRESEILVDGPEPGDREPQHSTPDPASHAPSPRQNETVNPPDTPHTMIFTHDHLPLGRNRNARAHPGRPADPLRQ